MKSGYVTILVDGDRLIVSTNGYIYCLDPLTGSIHVAQSDERLWHGDADLSGVGAGTES